MQGQPVLKRATIGSGSTLTNLCLHITWQCLVDFMPTRMSAVQLLQRREPSFMIQNAIEGEASMFVKNRASKIDKKSSITSIFTISCFNQTQVLCQNSKNPPPQKESSCISNHQRRVFENFCNSILKHRADNGHNAIMHQQTIIGDKMQFFTKYSGKMREIPLKNPFAVYIFWRKFWPINK